MKHIYILLLSFSLLFSCTDIDDCRQYIDIEVGINYPDNIDVKSLSNSKITLHNITTGADSSFDMPQRRQTFRLPPGLYDVSYVALTTLAGGGEGTLRASLGGADLTSNSAIVLDAYATASSNDLIIKEIFFTGTLQRSGNQYIGDQYIKLVNNTDQTIYADGLVLFESLFLTTQKYDYKPDIMSEAVSVDALYAIPGSGSDYPVAPGGEILIADIAIDHRAINPNSFDLSHADFEWYDQSSSPSTVDIDNPAVPNLDKWYCYTKTIFQLHNRGFKAYGLARVPIDKNSYMARHYYTCDYEQVTSAGVFPMSKSGYAMPNEWITDVVNLSVQSGYQWCVTAPQLDSSWAFCGTLQNDKNRYFKAVRRKVAAFDRGRPVFADTNNSADNFNCEVTPSEIELQTSACSADGTPATTITSDGKLPL